MRQSASLLQTRDLLSYAGQGAGPQAAFSATASVFNQKQGSSAAGSEEADKIS